MEKQKIELTREQIKKLLEKSVSKSYLGGIQYAIDVLTNLKEEIEKKEYKK